METREVKSPGGVQDRLFGTLALQWHFVLPQQIDEALAIQQELQQSGQDVPRLGEILAQRGYMTREQVIAVLQGQLSVSTGRFGEVAVGLRLCSQGDVDAALGVQKDIASYGGNSQRIGEILVARGVLRPHQVLAVLQAQGKAVLSCPGCKTRLNAKGVKPGVPVRCPKCSKVFVPMGAPNATAGPKPAAPAAPPPQIDDVRVEHSLVMAPVKAPSEIRAAVGNTTMATGSNIVIGEYQIGPKLGSDSSGLLYRAAHIESGTLVALRILNPQMVQSPESFDNWISAGHAASELEHPNIQRIVSINSENDRAYVVMEYVEGSSLRKSLQQRFLLPKLEAIDILIQVAEALAYGHSYGLLHGDLRPTHILIGNDGIVRVSSLGLPKNVGANLRQVAGMLGDEALPLFTAPEVMIDEDEADERSDIYSLGAIGYQMLTGRPPHEGKHFLQVGMKIASAMVVPPRQLDPEIPTYLDRLIQKCLQPDPEDRYESTVALLADLRKARNGFLASVADVQDIASDLRTGPKTAYKTMRSAPVPARKGMRTYMQRTGSNSRNPAVARRARTKSRGSGVHTIPNPMKGKSSPTLPAASPAPPLPPPSAPPFGGEPFREPPPEQLPGGGGIDDVVQEVNPLKTGSNAKMRAAEAASARRKPLPDPDELPAHMRRKEGKGEVEKPGMSFGTLATITGVLLAGIITGIVLMIQKKPETPVVTTPQKDPAEIAAEESAKVTAQIKAPAPTGKEREWRLLQEYVKKNHEDHRGITDRLVAFKLAFVDGKEPDDIAQETAELLRFHSAAGSAASLPSLHADLDKLLTTDRFHDTQGEIAKWKDVWKYDLDAEKKAAALQAEMVEKQKKIAETRLADAARLRREKKFDEAQAIYRRVIENFDAPFADKARSERSAAEEEARTSRVEAEQQAKQRREAAEMTAKEQAAPGRVAQLAKDLDAAFKTFDLATAKTALDANAELIANTIKEPEFQALKKEYEHLRALQDRIAKAHKEGRYASTRVTYQWKPFKIQEVLEKGPVLEGGTGAMTVAWGDLGGADLAELAKRASNLDSGPEVLEVAMLQFFVGRYPEALMDFGKAEKLGQVAGRFKEELRVKLKDIAATTKQPEVAPPTPLPNPPAPGGTPPTPATKPDDSVAKGDPDVIRAFAARGLEVNRGRWKIDGDIYVASEDPDSNNPNLMSLKRVIKKDFKSISIDVRGTGKAAGFSFGQGKRYVISPKAAWQKVTIERRDTTVVMLVDNVEKPSDEPVAATVTPANIADEGTVYIRFEGTTGEFRQLIVK